MCSFSQTTIWRFCLTFRFCMLLIIQIFLWPLLGLAEKIIIQIWKLFKTREVTRRGWSGTEVVSECSIKYSFKPRDENDFFGGKKSLQGGSSCVKAQRAEKFGRKLLALTYAILSRFIHFLEDFGQGKCSFGSKQRFLGKKFTITWYIMHIMTKTFVAIFALAENLLTSTTLLIFMSSYRLVGFFFMGKPQ